MKHYIIKYIVLLLSFMVFPFNMNAIDANSILKNVSEKFNNCKSISATFSLIDNGHSENGSIIIEGNKFAISTQHLLTWFDGKTQWSYSPEINEVNISEPTEGELQQINPFAIISNFRNEFTANLINSNSESYKIQLTPKNTKHTIKLIELTINSSTYFPSLIVITAKNGTKATIKVNSIKTGNIQPSSTFIFNAKNFPNVEIVDLR